jgi:tetratricopeptide (TPR) repeat protein
MRSDYKHPVVLIVLAFCLVSGLAMFYFQYQGYDASIGWSLTAESELDEIVTYQFQKGPVEFQIKGEKISLMEAYVGDEIDPNTMLSTSYFYAILLGIGILLACATYLKQLGFIVFSGLFIVFLTMLDLTGYMNQGNWVVLVPFVLVAGTGYFFHVFWYQSIFLIRALVMSALLIGLTFLLPGEIGSFVPHFFANGLMSIIILAILFIILVSEEILFGLLYILTQNKGSSGNLKHWLILGGVYVANLIAYYLNRAGIFDFSYTFMNPYVLLFISFLVALWSLQYKYELIKNSVLFIPAFVAILALGLITFSILGYGFEKGMDGIYEGLHYVIIYAHLGFGFFFLAYVLVNFIDPMVRGIQVYKIVYKPQSFHYITARISGFVAMVAFFALSSQVSLNLFKASKYNLLGDIASTEQNADLAITYYKQAEFYGYNTHYTNYQLGTIFLNQNKIPAAREHFLKATSRYPSAQAFLNTSNLQSNTDLSLSLSYLNQGLNYFPNQPELISNLGLIQLKNEQTEKALALLGNTVSEQQWNQAPVVNTWKALSNLRDIRSNDPESSYATGNLAVKTNVLSALLSSETKAKLSFDTTGLKTSFPLHRQAYLLNASYVMADTLLQRAIENELNVQGIGLQSQLRRALARNQYVSGNVKSAFQTLDYIQQGKSGPRAGEVLNEMGMLALDQHAPLDALEFFDKALGNGYKQANFNRLFALLEASKFAKAKAHLNLLVASDSSLKSLEKSLSNVFKAGSDTTAEANFNELYYRGMEWPVEKIKTRLDEFNATSQQLVLEKLSHEIENRGIDPSLYATLKIPIPDYTSLTPEQLRYFASQRPFDEGLVILAAETLSKDDAIGAYSLLNSSLEFNPFSIPLLKAQALSTIDINLPEYADSSFDQLSNLVSGAEFAAFQIHWYKKKTEKTSDWPY